jgi:hypothetical protein
LVIIHISVYDDDDDDDGDDDDDDGDGDDDDGYYDHDNVLPCAERGLAVRHKEVTECCKRHTFRINSELLQ